MSHSLLKDEKGVYSTLSSFLFIIVVVAVVIALIFMNAFNAFTQSQLQEKLSTYELSADAKARIEHCYDGISEKKLDAGTECKVPELKGYSVTTLNLFNCKEKQWLYGSFEECKNKFSYFVDVKMQNDICLARLQLCQ